MYLDTVNTASNSGGGRQSGRGWMDGADDDDDYDDDGRPVEDEALACADGPIRTQD